MTRHRDVEQLDQIVGLVRDVLGVEALGAYLHGSTALDELKPHSDIDVIVLSRRATTLEEKRALIERLLRISGRGDSSGEARPIELTIVVESAIRPWRYPPSLDFLYGDWMRAEFERGDLTPWDTPNPDLAPVITMVRSSNRALFGPLPAEAFDPVPLKDLNRAIVEGIPGLLDELDSDTTNVVLTFARIWTTLATGTIRSKDAAADWALARMPEEHRPVLARARAVYLGEEDDHWVDLQARLRPHVDHVLGEIERFKVSQPALPYRPSEKIRAKDTLKEARMATPTTVDDYLATVAHDRRAVVEELRRTIKAAAPEATETIAYGMPALRSHGGQFLVSYAAYKKHYSLFPASGAVVEALGKELAPYLAGKGTIQFPADRPIPATLVKRIVMVRVAENKARADREGGAG